jgi:hypothetical protein
MADAVTALLADDGDSTTEAGAETTPTTEAANGNTAAGAGKDGTETGAQAADKGSQSAADDKPGKDADKAADGTGKKADGEKATANWREEDAGENDEYLKLLSRYGSRSGVVKALYDLKQAVAQGKFQRGKPDESDAKAMAEWKKQEGIPDKPEDYKLPDEVTKHLTDADKPVLANFTEFAHAKGARPDVVSIASEWYVQQQAAAMEQQTEADSGHREETEDALRLDWQGEFKGNMTLAKRFLNESPLGVDGWAGLRDATGRLLGSNPEFLKWASDQGRERFGDSVFANPDSEKNHNSEKAEIENILKTDRARYFRDGYDKKYAALLEREEKRAKK